MPLQIRRGTDAERLAMTQPLAAGELLYVTDTQRIYVGNNSTLGGVAVTGYTDNDAKDAAAQIFTGGSHTGINFTYNTVSNLISASLDLSNYQGIVNVNAVKGSVFADDSTLLVDAVNGVITAPLIGNVTGNVTGNLTGNVTGNVTGNIFTTLIDSADSSAINVTPAVIFNSDVTVENEIIGNLVGQVNGELFGKVKTPSGTIIVDDITRAGSFSSISLDQNGFIGSPDTIFILPTTSAIMPFDNADSFTPRFVYQTNNTNSFTNAFGFVRGRGSFLTPSVVNNGDELMKLIAYGFDGTTYFPSASINVIVDGVPSVGAMPSKIELTTQDASGLASVKLSCTSTAVNFFTPPVLPVVADDAARTLLVPSPTQGMLLLMQSGTTPAATNVVQVYDGSAWVNLH